MNVGAGLEAIRPWIGTGLLGVIAFVLVRFSGPIMRYLVDRRRVRVAERAEDRELEVHRDELTFQLLTAARSELAQMREEVGRLRPMEAHLLHFEQALDHIEKLLRAHLNAELWVPAARAARAFINRMRRLTEARGTLSNEIQRIDSAISQAEVIPPVDRKGD